MAKAARHLAAVPQPTPPKLIEQLKELREEWGEGFDEDIAQPLAKLLLILREQLAAVTTHHEATVEEITTNLHRVEGLLEAAEETKEPYENLLADLEDVHRGVRTVEELYERWLPRHVV